MFALLIADIAAGILMLPAFICGLLDYQPLLRPEWFGLKQNLLVNNKIDWAKPGTITSPTRCLTLLAISIPLLMPVLILSICIQGYDFLKLIYNERRARI